MMRKIPRTAYRFAATVLGVVLGGASVVAAAFGMSGSDGSRMDLHNPGAVAHAPPSCSLSVAGLREIRTAEGDIPYVAPWSIAASEGRHFLAGGPAFLWSGDARAMDPPIDSTGLVGVVIDEDGTAAVVRNPLPGRHALHPRVATRPAGGWYVLLVASDSADDLGPVAREVTLWLGVYDRRWESLEEIGSAHTHLLRPEQSSELVLRSDGELGFAYGYMHAKGNGVVMLRRTREGWSSDTLHLDRFIHHVELRGGPNGAWTIAYRPDRIAAVAGSSFVRLVSYDSTWHEPVVAISDSLAIPDMLRVYALDGEVVALWAVNTGDSALYGIRWGFVDRAAQRDRGGGALAGHRGVLDGGAGSLLSRNSFDFVAVPVDSGRLLVLTRGSTPRRGVVVDLLTRRGAERLLEIPVENVVGPAAVLTGAGSILMIMTTEAADPGMHPVMMNAISLRLRC
jgi:hypothetical protein